MIFTSLKSFPRIKLAQVPTPIEEMPNLAQKLHVSRLYVKRDDCTGLAFGGNKARQLEYYFGEALERGADTVLITGAIQSNYARMTAAAACRLGLKCHIQLEERVPNTDDLYQTSGNVLLDRLMGAELHFYPEGEDEEGADLALELIAEDLQKKGAKPYVIHLGLGPPPLGALGYIDAAKELSVQIKEMGLKIDEIVIPSGSGQTHAGLLFGLRTLGNPVRITGNCHRRDAAHQKKRISGVLEDISKLLSAPNPTTEKDIVLFDGVMAPGYGQINDATREAIQLAAQNEALFCDPVYSGRALAGTIALIRQGHMDRDSSILFWHTGGQPAIFAYGNKLFKTL
ncbi:D-cysteine desulfhydrase family protein [Acidobacteriota bacterium]